MPSKFWMRNATHCLIAFAFFYFALFSSQAQTIKTDLGLSGAPAVSSESSSTAGFDDETPALAGNDSSAELLRTAIVGEGNSGAGGGGKYMPKFSVGKLALEFGGGFNAPVGNDTPYITWGGNFTIGGGIHFNNYLAVLGEYQFMDNKLPGALIASTGFPGDSGNSYINSLTISPVIDFSPKSVNSLYATGGFGWYHKSTEFSEQACCDFYGYPVSITDYQFSSNQWGGNIGLGFTHKIGGRFGDSRTKLFAEVRYLYLHTPPITQTNGLGTTGLIPVTFGIRW